MNYDYELKLISKTFKDDGIGNKRPIEKEEIILCAEKSVGRTEFYAAAAVDLKPSIVLVVHSYEYNGETIVEYEGTRYKIIKTYKVSFEELELTCERV